MDQKKYIGMEVHQARITVAVRDATGKVVAESIIETKAITILEFIRGIKGVLWVTFEEGTSAAWLYDRWKPHVTKVMVCDPRKNALLTTGRKNDQVDAGKRVICCARDFLRRLIAEKVRTLRELVVAISL